MSAGIPFGNYRLIRRIARGGMAEVFLATQQGPSGFERAVALKRILPHLADDPQFVEMFMDEARLAAQLSHSNIAHIYEFGRVEDSYFIAMEHIDGIDLSAVILDGPKQPMPLELAARIIADVCAALHYAHSLNGKNSRPLNLVHRDISPQNILVAFNGAVKVVDFGIAKAAILIERTRPGVVRGKYTYMSPEQVDGKVLDGRADLFCAGIVLYELCTCEALFPRTEPIQAMRRIRAGDIPPPRRAGASLPPHLEKIILRALARNRDERYRNAAEMQMDLEAFLRTVPQIVSSIALGEYFTRHYRQLRPLPELQSNEPKERTVGAIRVGGGGPGTAPIEQARRNPPEPEARTIALTEEQARVRREDLAATQVRPAPQAPTAGTIHGLETALKPVPEEDLDQSETPRPARADGSEGETVAFGPPPLPRATSAADARGEIDAQPTLIHDATPHGITIDPGMQLGDAPTVVPGLSTNSVAFHQVAMTRAPELTRSRPRLRSIARRLLVVGLIVLVAGAGVLAGYFLSEPAPLLSAGARADGPPPARDLAAAARRDPSPDLAAASQPAEGTLEINSRPEGATVTVDGIEVQGVTPIRRAFFAGSHTIVASYPGFEDRAQKVRLEAGQTVVVNLTLRRLQPEQIVTLKSENGKKPGKKVRPKVKGKKVAAKAEPTPASSAHGYLTIATTPWSSVFLGERKLGITPFANVKVPAGKHTLRFTNDRGATFTRVVTVRPDQVTKLSFKLPGA